MMAAVVKLWAEETRAVGSTLSENSCVLLFSQSSEKLDFIKKKIRKKDGNPQMTTVAPLIQ